MLYFDQNKDVYFYTCKIVVYNRNERENNTTTSVFKRLGMRNYTTYLREIIFILSIIIFQQSLYAQKEIVGIVEFYKSEASEFGLLRDSKGLYTKNLNRRISEVQFIQKDSAIKIETDSLGVFKINIPFSDSLIVSVNKNSSYFNGEFKFAYSEIKDTLRLRISDKKYAIKVDSYFEPEFYNKYNEAQAELNFKNGKREILLIQHDWPKDETIEKRNRVEIKYNVTYEGIFNANEVQARIMYRYNKVMRDLMGIKESVW